MQGNIKRGLGLFWAYCLRKKCLEQFANNSLWACTQCVVTIAGLRDSLTKTTEIGHVHDRKGRNAL